MDGRAAGAICALAGILIFLIGIPALRYFLPAAILIGGASLAIRRIPFDAPGEPWIPVSR